MTYYLGAASASPRENGNGDKGVFEIDWTRRDLNEALLKKK